VPVTRSKEKMLIFEVADKTRVPCEAREQNPKFKITIAHNCRANGKLCARGIDSSGKLEIGNVLDARWGGWKKTRIQALPNKSLDTARSRTNSTWDTQSSKWR